MTTAPAPRRRIWRTKPVEVRLLDAVMSRLGYTHDAAFAAFLDVDRTAIYAIRSGKSSLSANQRIKALDGIPYFPDTSIQNLLSSPSLKQRLLERASPKLQSRWSAEPSKEGQDADLVMAIKSILEFSSHERVAQFLGMTHSGVSRIWNRERSLGILPRLRILNHVDESMGTGQLYELLTNTRAMLRWLSA